MPRSEYAANVALADAISIAQSLPDALADAIIATLRDDDADLVQRIRADRKRAFLFA